MNPATSQGDRSPTTTSLALLRELRDLGVQLWADGERLRYRAPNGVLTDAWLAQLKASKPDVLALIREEASSSAVVPHPEERFEPFPLTPVQSAYLLGQQEGFAYGGVGCHGYGEITYPDLDVPRLEAALQRVLARHEMLRAVVHRDGWQEVLREVPVLPVPSEDLRGRSADQVEAALASTRDALVGTTFAPGSWPLLCVRVSQLDDAAVLHLVIDFLVADFVSIDIVLDDLTRFYLDPEHQLAPLEISFRDLQMAVARGRRGERYERDRAYWWERVDRLPGPPELPLVDDPGTERPVRFTRSEHRLGPEAWTRFGRCATQHGVSTSVAVLTAYAETLARWSRVPHFTLDLTVLERPDLHPQVGSVVGDFTGVELLEVDLGGSASFAARAAAVQQQLWSDLDHRTCDGVEVIREIARRRGSAQALFPVVFTSALGLAGPEGPSMGGILTGGLSTTPQVQVDCQNVTRRGGLDTNWDVRRGVFQEGVAEMMFSTYAAMLDQLASDPDAWTSSSDSLAAIPEASAVASGAEAVGSGATLDSIVRDVLMTRHAAPVLITEDRTMSGAELLARVDALVVQLQRAGVSRGDLVGVVLDKSVNQTVAVLAVLGAGAVYVPVDTNQPVKRRQAVIRRAGVSAVVTGHEVTTRDGPLDAPVTIEIEDVAPDGPSSAVPRASDDLAYVIHTSGSTGEPKGVAVTHAAASTTCSYIAERFELGPQDLVLALTGLGFDLSVFDLFGVLGCGGAQVVPNASRRGDPSHWMQLMTQHGVTVWNSVPAQMQMLLDYLDAVGGMPDPALRLVLLSGDWIPVSQPDKIRQHFPGARVVCLGGATEASIWSVAREVVEQPVPPGWRSIPYGRALRHQSIAVLDDRMRERPPGVVGEIYLGGSALARGYLNDPVETSARFVHHPRTGERLYRTGDLGRYLSDGDVEFLGREDSQVKVRGHRIEAAEVEAALMSHPYVGSAAVVAWGATPLERQLVAFVAPARRAEGAAPAAGALVTAADRAGDLARRGVTGERVAEFAAALDHAAALAMMRALQAVGIFADPNAVHSGVEIATRAGVQPRHDRLLRRWLRTLVFEGMLRVDGSERYGAVRAVAAAEFEQAWATLDRHQDDLGSGALMVDYFRRATDSLPELLRGEQDPLGLLFPDARADVHEALYQGNVASRYVNAVAQGALHQRARQEGRRGPLRILEVGAGVGGASADLIASLAAEDVEYHFTHVSPFFLNIVSDRFHDEDWVTYGTLDLNDDLASQGYAPHSFDVVVCQNAMHYARNAPDVVRRLTALLRAEGLMIMVEAVRDNYQVLTSTEFLLDGQEDFTDVRAGRDETFLSRDDWRAVVADAGGHLELVRPSTDDGFSAAGLAVFVASFKTDQSPLDVDDLARSLSTLIPDYMLPGRIDVLDELPLTVNGKIDRSALECFAAEGRLLERQGTGAAPQTDLEARLAHVWAKALRREKVSRDEDFFVLGGDSLLAAQLAGALREEVGEASGWSFDGLLRELLNGPTVEGLAGRLTWSGTVGAAAAVSDPDDNGTQSAMGPLLGLVHLSNVGADVLDVVMFDEEGGLLLLDEVLAAMHNHADTVGVVVEDVDALLAMDSATASAALGAHVVELVVATGRAQVRLLGVGPVAALAVEAARGLVDAGVQVLGVTVVDGQTPPPVDLASPEKHDLVTGLAERGDRSPAQVPTVADALRGAAASVRRDPLVADLLEVVSATAADRGSLASWADVVVGDVQRSVVPVEPQDLLRGPEASHLVGLHSALGHREGGP